MRPGDPSQAGTTGQLARASAWAFGPRWRRFLVIGWVVYAVSFLLPTLVNYVGGRIPGGEPFTSEFVALAGWEAFVWALMGAGEALGVISALTNVLILGSASHRKWSPDARWPALVLVVATILNASWWPLWVASEGDTSLRIGYFAWVASFACLAVAFWLRQRGRAVSAAD